MSFASLAPRLVVTAAACLAVGHGAAFAQATRTWVSGVGDDVNPCSRTAPCKTFAGAISKTAAGGEISVLDPGGFGAVTITKSITIDGGGIHGSILASATNGVNINRAGITVVLRNLSINGAGTGLVGVNIINASSVHLDNVSVFGFNGGAARGISVAVATDLYVSNSSFRNNGTAAAGAALHAQAGARVTVERSVFHANLDGVSAGTGAEVSVRESTVSGSRNCGVIANGSGAEVHVENSVITQNVFGAAVVAGGTIRLANVGLVSNRETALYGGGGAIVSYGNNRIIGSSPYGQFSDFAVLQ